MRGERGFTLIETMVALGIIVALIVGLTVMVRALGNNAAAAATSQQAVVTLGRVIGTLETTAKGAVAVYLPSPDALGQANTDGHEVAFYAEKNDKTPEVYSFRYQAGVSGALGSIQEYSWTKPGGTATAIGPAIAGFSGMTAVSSSASLLTDPMFVAAPKAHDIATGFPGVVGGTHRTLVTISILGPNHTTEQRTIDLGAGVLLSEVKTITALWTPAPSNPFSVVGGMSVLPTSTVIPAPPNNTAQQFTVYDDPYYVGPYISQSSTQPCDPTILTVTPGGTTILGRGSNMGNLAYTVTPLVESASNYSCIATIADGFGRTVNESINLTAAPPMVTWPASVGYAPSGETFAEINVGHSVFNVAALLNGALGGGIADASAWSGCAAIAMKSDGVTPDTSPPAWVTALGVSVNGSGCYGGQVLIDEPSGASKTFTMLNNSCATTVWTSTTWSPSNIGVSAALGAAPGSTLGTCSITLDDGSGGSKGYYSGLVSIAVVGPCSRIGATCTFTAVPWPNDDPYCTWGDGAGSPIGPTGTGEYSLGNASSLVNGAATTSDAYGYITTNSNGSVTFTRTALGADIVSAYTYNVVSWVFLTNPACRANYVYELSTSWSV